ncbi:hypothetical protein [Acidisphaera sp. L21]|uniref:hypothetical protein n=1 Tax=Acidisphaera sp. L21 TaxID=1641851 RepID=UPI001C201635|nr:hypothetical protein [Acidisphaera sp. L21]
MTSPITTWFDGLAGMIITRAEAVHDYVQIAGKEGIISIYNDWNLFPVGTGLSGLLKARVISAYEKSDALTFSFDTAAELIVNMSDAAWRGPEALQVTRSGLPIVVWRK